MKILAALINLIVCPGAGHVAIGRWRRGIPWLVLQLASAPLGLVHPVALMVAMLGARVGAAVEVSLLRAEPTGWLHGVLSFGGGVMVMVAFSMTSRAYVIEAFKIPSGAMIPTLEIGDHIFVSKLSVEPARGEMAVYINPCQPDRDFVHRIVALAGDTVEVRCDVLYVNGAAAGARSLKEECRYWDKDKRGIWVEQQCVTYLEALDGVEHELVYPPDERDRHGKLEGDRDFPEIRIPACPEGEPVGRIENAPSPQTHACAPQRHYVVPDGHVFVMGDNRHDSSDSRAWGPVPIANLKGKVISIWWSGKPQAQGGIQWGRIGPID